MKKITKFGIITMSVFALNLVSQSVVQADEKLSEVAETSVTLGNTSSSESENSSIRGDKLVEISNSSDSSTKVEVTTTENSTRPVETTEASSQHTTETDTSKYNNIIDEGGYVNVEGLPAHFTEDGKSVVYNYTVAFKGMHSSDRGQTVRDIRIRIPKIAGAKADFTLMFQ